MLWDGVIIPYVDRHVDGADGSTAQTAATLVFDVPAGTGVGHLLEVVHVLGMERGRRGEYRVAYTRPSVSSAEVLSAQLEGPKSEWRVTVQVRGSDLGASSSVSSASSQIMIGDADACDGGLPSRRVPTASLRTPLHPHHPP